VLLRHIVHYWPTTIDNKYILSVAYNGWLGVDLFFVLSGFLIFFHLLEKWPKNKIKSYIKIYFIKRGLRILPLYFFIILLIYFEMIPFYQTSLEINEQTIANHFLFIHEYFYSPILVTLWSLATEEKFYLFAPILIYLLKQTNNLVLISIVIVFIVFISINNFEKINLLGDISYPQYFWGNRAPFQIAVRGLLLGGVTAIGYNKFRERVLNERVLNYIFYSTFSLILMIFLYMPYLEFGLFMLADIMILLFSLACCMLVFCGLFLQNKITSILSHKTLRVIAILSYALYITHVTVIPWSIHFTNQFKLVGYPYVILLIFTYLTISFLFSLILHYFVEKPFLIFKSKL